MSYAAQIYMANGLVLRACRSAFWPLFFVRLVTDVDLSPLQLVLLGTVFELTIFVSEIPTGVVADIYSRRLSIVISFVLGGLAIVMSAIVSPYWLLVLSQIAMGFAGTFLSGAETAWITDELDDHDETEALILQRAQWQLVAGIVGILVFAGLAALTTLTTTLATIGVIYVIWGLLLRLRMPEANFSRTEGEGWSEFFGMLGRGFERVKAIKALRILVLVTFIGGLAKEAIDRLDVQRLVDVGLPDDIDEALVIGVLVSIRMAVAALLLMISRSRARGHSVVGVMVVFLVGVAGGIALLAHVELLAIAALGMILQGGFHSATEPLVINWTNTFASSEARATIHSFIGQAEAFGEILGGIALGTVAEVFSVPTAMTISSILFLIAAALAATTRDVWDSSVKQGAGVA